jgi:hypothetical protein
MEPVASKMFRYLKITLCLEEEEETLSESMITFLEVLVFSIHITQRHAVLKCCG